MRSRHKHVWLWPWQAHKRCVICGRLDSLAVGENTVLMTDSYVEITDAAAPGNAAAGTRRMFLDSGNGNKLSLKDSAGTIVVVEGSGGMLKTVTPGYNATIFVTSVGTTYVQVRSAAGNALYLTHITLISESVILPGAVDLFIGTGTAASEVTVSKVPVPAIPFDVAAGNRSIVIPLPTYIPVPAATRIAVKQSGGSAVVTVGVTSIDQANVVAI